MKYLGITQRVVNQNNERRDTLDQRWTEFLDSCGYSLIPISNKTKDFKKYFQLPLSGILLTGGNTLSKYGGDAPERDALEHELLAYCIEKKIPILGVCRGMQVILDYFNIDLQRIDGHVTPEQKIFIHGKEEVTNSYHEFGTKSIRSPLENWATAEDGTVKGIYHKSKPVLGLMWHPERCLPFTDRDQNIFKTFFEKEMLWKPQ